MTGSEIAVRRATVAEKIEYAKHLADSGLLPVAYRRQPANVFYATEYGEMLGLAPLAAITGLHIIEGKPTGSSGMVSALVRRAGHRLRCGYDATKKVGWCEIVRHDDPEFTYRAEWSLERAVAAGLCELRNGRPFARDTKGKPKPWELYPEAMMKARAITECARDACEEALNGVHYTPEELGADVDESGEPIRVEALRDDRTSTVDWDVELAQAGTDLDALRAVWERAKTAEPNNTPLAERIKAAVAAAKTEQPDGAEPAEQQHTGAAADQPAAGEIVDAEVVNTPGDGTETVAPQVRTTTTGHDGTFDPAEVRHLLAEARRAGTVEEFMPWWDKANKRQWMTLGLEGDTLQHHLRKEADRIKRAASARSPAASTEPWPATAEQLTTVHILLGKCGVTDPLDKRVTLGQMVGRNLGSSKELTHPEAARIIGVLRGLTEGDSDPATALTEHLDRLTRTAVSEA